MVDTERSAAMRGNRNAAGPRNDSRPAADKHGIRLGIVGGLIPLGSVATGAIIGASNKSEKAKSRQASATASVRGGVAYYVNRATGHSKKASAGGALIGAGVSYVGAKLGQYAGKKISGK